MVFRTLVGELLGLYEYEYGIRSSASAKDHVPRIRYFCRNAKEPLLPPLYRMEMDFNDDIDNCKMSQLLDALMNLFINYYDNVTTNGCLECRNVFHAKASNAGLLVSQHAILDQQCHSPPSTLRFSPLTAP